MLGHNIIMFICIYKYLFFAQKKVDSPVKCFGDEIDDALTRIFLARPVFQKKKWVQSIFFPFLKRGSWIQTHVFLEGGEVRWEVKVVCKTTKRALPRSEPNHFHIQDRNNVIWKGYLSLINITDLKYTSDSNSITHR